MIEIKETVNAVIWVPIILIGGAAVAATLVFTKFGKKLKDKKLGILGLLCTGKTTLAEYLANNYIPLPEEITQTFILKKYKELTLGDLGMQIGINDTRSHYVESNNIELKYDYTDEKDMLITFDIIIYLFDMSKLFITSEKDKCFKEIKKEIRIYSREFINIQKKIDEEKQKLKDSEKTLLDTLSNKKKSIFEKNKPSEPREKIFIALGSFADKIDKLGLNQTELKSQFINIQKQFIELFKEFNCYCDVLFFNSLVNKDEANETFKRILESLKKAYSEDRNSFDNGSYNALENFLNKRSV